MLRSQWVTRYQAFFSFEDGPVIVMCTLLPERNCTVSWAGLPVYFFVREGLAYPHGCAYAGGTAPIAELGDVRSAWWCVDNKLGLVTTRDSTIIRGVSTIGYNWARKPLYRDKSEMLAISPLEWVSARADEPVADFAAALYSPASDSQMKAWSSELIDLSAGLPKGWRGIVTPSGNARGERVLAVVHFSGSQMQASLELGFADGAPVLEQETLIIGSRAMANLSLQPLRTVEQTLNLYVAVPGGVSVKARRLTKVQFEIEAVGTSHVPLRVRYRGPVAQRIRLLDDAGEPLGTLAVGDVASMEGANLELHGRVIIEVQTAQSADKQTVAVDII